ncbi:MAG TPA: ATPase, partial [Cyclobacteriaceae bacterium]|nr:ATPase [Cyclobacteriaceae bacterium]
KMQSGRKEEEVKRESQQQRTTTTTTRTRKEKSTLEEVMSSPVSKQIGRELVRGVFGMLFGTTRTRRR